MGKKYTVRFDESDAMTDIPDGYFKVAYDILMSMSKHSDKPSMEQYNELVRKISSYTTEELSSASCSILHIYTELSIKNEELDFHTCYSYTLVLSTMIHVLRERTKF